MARSSLGCGKPGAKNTKFKEAPTLGLVTVQGVSLQEPESESRLKSQALNEKLTFRAGALPTFRP